MNLLETKLPAMTKLRKSNKLPSRKVTAGGLAGALSIIVVWIVNQSTGTNIPPQVASAITTILTFLASYMIPSAD
jgi:putative flippase GtrA